MKNTKGMKNRSGLAFMALTSLMIFMSTLARTQTPQYTAIFYQSGVHFDMEKRRSAPLPAPLREKAQTILLA